MGLGKWIAGALGWVTLGPLGGLLGFLITARFEALSEAVEQYNRGQYGNQEQRNSFLMSLLHGMDESQYADGNPRRWPWPYV